MLIKIANYIGQTHSKFFLWLSNKSKVSVWFALGLTAYALYEIFEHIALPTIGILWAMGKVSF